MQLSDEAIEEFIKIYEKDFKKKLIREVAREMAIRVITLYELLAKKLPSEQNSPDIKPLGDEPHRPMGFQT